ncbi:hypothetical protein OHB36_25050 [Streptomyces sp. NBC_00320]|uniref:hypothetical protein n=2 Tax=Streptomyces TaxID=1883 RepID=UPI00224DA18D|nr:hypothetical protein [Streptomyces sp. NBC_00320]MCX5150000.1 hypothetical protein [Streptomyces sp. NBC_00320]
MPGPTPDDPRLENTVLERKQLKDRTPVAFVLPESTPEGPVSMVRDFNHRNPAHSTHSFRYLAAGDYWFDDPSADGHDGANSHIHIHI